LSMMRTVLIRPDDGSAIPRPLKLNGGGISAPVQESLRYFFLLAGASVGVPFTALSGQ
jgi:hypothetical protein